MTLISDGRIYNDVSNWREIEDVNTFENSVLLFYVAVFLYFLLSTFQYNKIIAGRESWPHSISLAILAVFLSVFVLFIAGGNGAMGVAAK